MENDLKERVDSANIKQVVIDFKNIGEVTGLLLIEKDSIYFYFNNDILSGTNNDNNKITFGKYVKYIGVYLDDEITFISTIKAIYLDSKCIYQKENKVEIINKNEDSVKKDDSNISSSLINSIWEQRKYDIC